MPGFSVLVNKWCLSQPREDSFKGLRQKRSGFQESFFLRDNTCRAPAVSSSVRLLEPLDGKTWPDFGPNVLTFAAEFAVNIESPSVPHETSSARVVHAKR